MEGSSCRLGALHDCRATAPTQSTTAQLLDHHVHQTLRHNDNFDDLVALNDGADFLIIERSRAQFFFRNLRRNQ